MTVGAQAIGLLRALAQAYYADGCLWGSEGVGEDDARRFMRAYESLMGAASPELQRIVLLPRAFPIVSEEQRDIRYTLEVP